MSMTLGKDVSALFPDVLKNIATSDLDQKKLVYLYLMYVLRTAFIKKMGIMLTGHQELRKIAPGSLYSSCQYIRSRFRRS